LGHPAIENPYQCPLKTHHLERDGLQQRAVYIEDDEAVHTLSSLIAVRSVTAIFKIAKVTPIVPLDQLCEHGDGHFVALSSETFQIPRRKR
jgi:hypothetical protein